ncbi:MAG: UGSC family (seleno)protein [Burkholderiales bacterium]
MPGTLTLFDPTAPARERGRGDARAQAVLSSLSGKVVGFIDNAKPNFGLLADDIGEVLKARFGVSRIVKHRKPSASVPAKPEVIDALSRECDVVIAGSGD